MEKLPHRYQPVRNLMAARRTEGGGRTPLTVDTAIDNELDLTPLPPVDDPAAPPPRL
jgi:hypothetical protein